MFSDAFNQWTTPSFPVGSPCLLGGVRVLGVLGARNV
jgi:hypothetical protein